jgi:lipopolysaccharide transport protein LptA
MCPRAAIARALAVGLLAATAAAAAEAQLPDLEAQKRLPINLEAASSQFDGLANRLTFQRVVITQGPMSIRADRGQADRLDFENTRWYFDGDVVLDNQGARVECDSAELLFEGYELRSAVLRGRPVELRQNRPGAAPTEGKAEVMDYDVTAATVRLSGDAWLSDGANEVSGENIAYDLAREYVTADAGEKGEIRMKIRPPRSREGAPSP